VVLFRRTSGQLRYSLRAPTYAGLGADIRGALGADIRGALGADMRGALGADTRGALGAERGVDGIDTRGVLDRGALGTARGTDGVDTRGADGCVVRGVREADTRGLDDCVVRGARLMLTRGSERVVGVSGESPGKRLRDMSDSRPGGSFPGKRSSPVRLSLLNCSRVEEFRAKDVFSRPRVLIRVLLNSPSLLLSRIRGLSDRRRLLRSAVERPMISLASRLSRRESRAEGR